MFYSTYNSAVPVTSMNYRMFFKVQLVQTLRLDNSYYAQYTSDLTPCRDDMPFNGKNNLYANDLIFCTTLNNITLRGNRFNERYHRFQLNVYTCDKNEYNCASDDYIMSFFDLTEMSLFINTYYFDFQNVEMSVHQTSQAIPLTVQIGSVGIAEVNIGYNKYNTYDSYINPNIKTSGHFYSLANYQLSRLSGKKWCLFITLPMDN